MAYIKIRLLQTNTYECDVGLPTSEMTPMKSFRNLTEGLSKIGVRTHECPYRDKKFQYYQEFLLMRAFGSPIHVMATFRESSITVTETFAPGIFCRLFGTQPPRTKALEQIAQKHGLTRN